jgi:3-deoxy-D-manno-octulosonic-acid transferase
MRVLYTLLLYLSLPVVLVRLWWRGFRAPAYRERWAERFGRFQATAQPHGVWVHAVSVGEVQAVAPLVRRLLDERPDLPVTVTTTTPTGSQRVRALFGDELLHVYLPYDLPLALNGFLARVRPRCLVMVETEVWPNLLAACEARGIRTLLANGRLSERSLRGYRKLGRLARDAFASIDRVAAQALPDGQRFIAAGVAERRVTVTGSIKFDMQIAASVQEQAQVLRRQWGDRPVWVAASTHEGEDEILLQAHRRLREHIPDALLVLVPRHPERFDAVAALCARMGLAAVRRSKHQVPGDQQSVFIGDTMGELPVFLGAADAAFFGGSLVPVGGHNMLEASAQGVPVVFGPHVFNFATISRLLLAEGGAEQVADSEQLASLLQSWLGDASRRSEVGERGRRVVAANRGALQQLWQLLLDEVRAASGPGQ